MVELVYTHTLTLYVLGHVGLDPNPLYVYLAHHNVHAASNEENYTLQSPAASVAFYNTTKLDTFVYINFENVNYVLSN